MASFQFSRPIPYAARRQHFLSEMTADVANSVAVIPANPEFLRNNDVTYKFRQDSNFYYLTGFNEPDAIAVLRNVGGKKEYVLFVRPKDLAKEIWTGYRAGVDGAVVNYGADRAYPIEEFEAQLLKLLQGADRVYYTFQRSQNRNGVELLDQKILRLLDVYRQNLGRSGRGLLQLRDPWEILGEMRLFKSPEEIERMRRAATITAKAHSEAMARVRPGLTEAQLEGLLEFVFRAEGADTVGYGSIVATGENATILHYVENNKVIKDGELLLIDAGCELDYYGADITRTFAVNGKMSREQRQIYEAVLAVQKECVRMTRPGVTLARVHDFAVEQLTDAMLSIGLLSGDRKQLIESLGYKKYYPHGTGHLLGMDVHDVGLYQKNGEPRKLEPGMVFTIEPGLYVLRDDANNPAYRGIGVRIEDDIVITSEGHEVLTSGVPKEVADLAALIGSKPWLEF